MITLKQPKLKNLETAEKLVEKGQRKETLDVQDLAGYIANDSTLDDSTKALFQNIQPKEGVSMDATVNELFTELPIDTQKQIIQGLRRQVNPGGFLGLRGLFTN